MIFPPARSRFGGSGSFRRSGLSWDLRLRRTGERLACGLDRSPDSAQPLRSRGGKLLLAFARRLLPPRKGRRFAPAQTKGNLLTVG